ncbi:hypothetical protein [Rhodococcus triatomae]|nr:hypothetical protein G419_20000 [Rhodococcus triatomae BKS 15-14]
MSTDSAHGRALLLADDHGRLAVDDHGRLAADDLERLAAGAGAAVRVEITGRAGVGRSSIVAALGPVEGAELVESAARDRPGFPDPALTGEIVVLVVLDPPRDVDTTAATEAADRLLPVLVKTDTLADPDSALDRVTAAVQAPCLPVSTVGAGAGIPRLRQVLEDRVRAVKAARATELLARLRTRADHAETGAFDDFLTTDAGVRLVAQATGLADPPGDARSRAEYWRSRMNTGDAPDALRAALALHRHAAREWTRRA